MRTIFVRPVICAAAWCLVPLAFGADAPRQDFTVQLRQINEGQDRDPAAGGAYIVGTSERALDISPQEVRVRNGEKASLQIQQSMPLQWVQKVEVQSATQSAEGASSSLRSSSQGGAISQALTWVEAGQSFTVVPHWSGGKHQVKVELEVHSSAVEASTGTDLPATARQRFSTTVSAPMNQWVTFAISGQTAARGSYSSSPTSAGRRLMQIRVTAD